MDDELLQLLKLAIRYFVLAQKPLRNDGAEQDEMVRLEETIKKLTQPKKPPKKKRKAKKCQST